MSDLERTRQAYRIGNSTVLIRLGDIATARTEVIVTSEDSELSMGGGTSQAVKRAAGNGFFERVQRLRDQTKVGKAVASDAGELAAQGVKQVFHGITIPSSRDRDVPNQAEIVRSCTAHCLDLLDTMEFESIAFPALGTGYAGFDAESSAVAMAEVIRNKLEKIKRSLRVEIWLILQGVDSDYSALQFFSSFTKRAAYVDVAVRDHHVLMIHGIRTQAEWTGRIRDELRLGDPSLNPIPIKYGFFDTLRFLLPFPWLRNSGVEAVRARIDAIDLEKGGRLSVIAHSFGTYITGQLLLHHGLHLHRLILCGGILAQNFPWGGLKAQVEPIGDPQNPTFRVVNDCGWKDIWPVMADALTLGYGASGRFGFGHPLVCDRYHPKGHSDFFDQGFATQYWLPVLALKQIEYGEDPPKAPLWLSVLTVPKLIFVGPVLILLLGWLSFF